METKYQQLLIEVAWKCTEIQKQYQKLLKTINWLRDSDEITQLHGLRYALDWGYGDFSKGVNHPTTSIEIATKDEFHGKESMESALWLPREGWCMEQVKQYLTEMNYRDNLWFVKFLNTSLNTHTFHHPNPNIVWMISAEYVLSGGKNDLRDWLKEVE